MLVYEPLAEKDLISLKGKWLVSKSGNLHSMVTDISKLRVTINGNVYNSKELLNTWNYEDGTPVGKIV